MPGSFVIFADDGPWRLASLDGDTPSVSIIETDADATNEQRAERACAVLHERGYTGEPVLLAVPSGWCAAASIPTDDLPRKDRQTAMAYRLEEKLPIEAEQFSADFILGGGEALGVCVILGKARPVVELLESLGVYIHSIIPAAMLATQHWLESNSLAEADVLIWQVGDWCDSFIFDPGHQRPVSWSLLPHDLRDITLHLNMMSIHGHEPVSVVLLGEDTGPIGSQLAELQAISEATSHREDIYLWAARGAGLILNDRSQPWVDLRGTELGAVGKTQLIHKPLKAVLAAAVLLLTCLNVAFLWRAHSYQGLTEHYINEQRTLFIDLFPDQAPPLTIDKRLASEFKKISGMRGKSEALPPPPMALSLLHQVLTNLPRDIRFRLIEVRIEDDSVYLDGQARSHGDVGSIANAIAGAGGSLKVETRHTEQLSSGSGVSFVIVAYPKNSSNPMAMR